jgi:hypothetical protein
MYNDQGHTLASDHGAFGKFTFDNPVIKPTFGNHLQKVVKNPRWYVAVLQSFIVTKTYFKDAGGFVVGDGSNSG